MSFDKTTIARIARLARIATTEAEQERLVGELGGIMAWVEQLDEVDVTGVEPMTSVAEMNLKSREDVVSDGGMAGKVLANAPKSAHGFFVVPKVVE